MKNIKYILPLFLSVMMLQNVCAFTSLSGESKMGLFIRSDFGTMNPDQLNVFLSDYDIMLSKFKEKRIQVKSDEIFLKHVFYRTHRKFLGDYEQGVSFHEMIGDRKAYDCVTGTALYALILEELGFSYEIRETDYHVYLLVFSGDKTFMMESTDPLYGFAINSKEIEARRNFVLSDTQNINEELSMAGVASQVEAEQTVQIIDNGISLFELAGLQYYNQALREFNNQNYREAYRYIVIAQGVYPSTRIKHASSYMFSVAFGD